MVRGWVGIAICVSITFFRTLVFVAEEKNKAKKILFVS